MQLGLSRDFNNLSLPDKKKNDLKEINKISCNRKDFFVVVVARTAILNLNMFG